MFSPCSSAGDVPIMVLTTTKYSVFCIVDEVNFGIFIHVAGRVLIHLVGFLREFLYVSLQQRGRYVVF
jgi:hypothetical protein